MRSNVVLKFFRAVALLLMLLGVLQAGAVLVAIPIGAMQEGVALLGRNDLERWLLDFPQFCSAPILTFGLGAILFVQVEIALRSGPPRDEA
jgi:hypothetical protein